MKAISFINMKGGVAKTTLAVNVADCLARRHQSKILIVDVDPQFNATQCLIKPEDYVQHLSQGKDTIIDIFDRSTRMLASAVSKKTKKTPKKLEDIKVVNVKNNIDLLPGNLELYRLEMAPGEGRENRLKSYLSGDGIVDNYDYVIIDTPPTPSVWMTSALIASDYYLIPVKADPISLTGIDLLKNIVEEKKENFALDIKCVGLVLTAVESNTTIYKEARGNLEADKYWRGYVYDSFLPKRVRIAKDQINQTTILDGLHSDTKTALVNITNELLERIEEDEEEST